MTKTRIAINGFGRIGRMVFRQAILDENIDVVAINASYTEEKLAHLIKYEMIHCIVEKDIETVNNSLIIDGQHIIHCNYREPEKLPLKEYDIDVAVVVKRKFNSKEGSSKYLEAGAKKVVITAP